MSRALNKKHGKRFQLGLALASGSSGSSGFGNLVAPSGGDYTTIQAAINADVKTFDVEGGNTYTENLTFDEACQRVTFWGDTIISGTVDITADNVIFICHGKLTVTGQIRPDGASGFAVYGNNGLLCQDGFSNVNVSSNMFIDGGGMNSYSDPPSSTNGFNVSSDSPNCTIMNLRAATDNGGSGTYPIALNNSDENFVFNVETTDADITGILINNTGNDNIVSECFTQGDSSMGDFIQAGGDRNIISGIDVVGTSTHPLDINGDDCVINDIYMDDDTINLAGNDHISHTARVDGAITDTSTGSTTAAHDTTAI